MIKTSLYSILFITALTSSTLIGMQPNMIDSRDEILERITLQEMGFSQENIDKLFKNNCTLETVQQLLGLDMSVQEIIDQFNFSETSPQNHVVIHNECDDPDKKNELIEDSVEEKSSEAINSVIIKLNTMGYPLGTINWWQNAGYNLDTIFELREAGIPLQEILNIFDEEENYCNNNQNNQFDECKRSLPKFTRTTNTINPLINSIQIFPDNIKLKCSSSQLMKEDSSKYTYNELTQEQRLEIDNLPSLTTFSDNSDDEKDDFNNQENIIITENHNSDFQESLDNQKLIKPKPVRMKRSEKFFDSSEAISEEDLLTACIQQSKDAYEKAIKPGLEHMQFELKTHTATFLTFAEEMTFYLLDKSGITNDANQKQFGLRLIEAILEFYFHQINRTRITFQNVEDKLNLSQIFSSEIFSDEETEIFRTIAFEHVDQTFLAFKCALNNLKLQNHFIKPVPQPLEKLYPLVMNAISQALQLKLECTKILQAYTSNDLVNSAAQQIGTSGKTIEWLVKILLTHTFHDEGIEIECLIGFNEKMNTFRAQQYTSFEELEKGIIALQTSLDEMLSGWLNFSQELKSFNEFE